MIDIYDEDYQDKNRLAMERLKTNPDYKLIFDEYFFGDFLQYTLLNSGNLISRSELNNTKIQLQSIICLNEHIKSLLEKDV